MTDWKQEHDAELGLRREWSARAQKAEAENKRLRAALKPFADELDLTEAQGTHVPPERMLMFASEGGGTFFGIDARTLYAARDAYRGVTAAGEGHNVDELARNRNNTMLITALQKQIDQLTVDRDAWRLTARTFERACAAGQLKGEE